MTSALDEIDLHEQTERARRHELGWLRPLQRDVRRKYYRAALAGQLPGEALPPRDGDRLIVALHRRGWSDLRIAEHTCWSTHTVCRKRARLHLPPNDKGARVMTWFFVDDKLHDHRKTRLLGKTKPEDKLLATGLWTLCGSWCADNLEDGFVPAEVVRRFDPKERAAELLVAVELWHHAERDGERGYRFHEWDRWQKTREEVLDRRRKRQEAGRKGGLRTAANRQANAAPSATADAQASAQAMLEHTVQAKSNPSPPLPGEIKEPPHPSDGSPPRKRGQAKSGDRLQEDSDQAAESSVSQTPGMSPELPAPESPGIKRVGTRLPADFAVSPEMVAWARDRVPFVDGRAETEKFINYWSALPGAKARKLDWPATWRNWMLNAAERVPSHKPNADDTIRDLLTTGTEATILQLPRGAS